jgi:hypothetical protein
MADYSLVPVDYQPDFSNISLVPVDHDPFSAAGIGEQAPAQPGGPPQQLASGVGQPAVGPPVNNVQTVASGESYHPDSESANGVLASYSPFNPSATPKFTPGNPAVDWSRNFQPSGELKPATYTPTQRIGNLAADALMGLGMEPYFANDLTSRVGNVLGLTPLGVAGSALDLIDAKRRDDLAGVLEAAAGMIPSAKGAARGVAEELHHAWPKYLGGAVKQELVSLSKSLHYAFHSGLDARVPKQRGTAYYESLGPAEKQQALQELATYTKNFDAEHGTKLYDALLKNGFPAP